MLALHIQADARCDQHLDARSRLEKRSDNPHAIFLIRLGPGDQVLEIIQHQEHGLLAQIVKQLLTRLLLFVKGKAERLGHRRHNVICRCKRGQRDKVDAVRPGVIQPRNSLCRQAGLAAAARANQGQ
jgi:hypothetical protein